jgi:ZIP family zinc transporter
MSFTAGVLIAVCFFDIIPEIFSIVHQKNIDITLPLIAIVVGYLVIHILEKYAALHHSHEGEYATHRHPQVGVVSALGLIFHSFLDGLGIGLGFHINPHIGLVVAIAVIAHDFSDGLNTVSLMLINKNSRRKAFIFLIFDAVAPIVGVLSTFLFTISDNVLVLYLGFFAGFLLYIGSSDLLPEAHSKHSSWKMIGLTILGVLLIFFITRIQ